jgi:hypothetical protein
MPHENFLIWSNCILNGTMTRSLGLEELDATSPPYRCRKVRDISSPSGSANPLTMIRSRQAKPQGAGRPARGPGALRITVDMPSMHTNKKSECLEARPTYAEAEFHEAVHLDTFQILHLRLRIS